MIEIQVRPFGALRKYEADCQAFRFNASNAVTIQEIKDSLKGFLQKRVVGFSDEILLDESVIASESKILNVGQSVDRSCTLLVLPPVCGG